MPSRSIYPKSMSKLKVKNLSKKPKKSTKVAKVSVFWRFFKAVTFVSCLTLFFFQSVKFLQAYYNYPTTTRIDFTYPEEFELPAFTFCSFNPIKRTKFCDQYTNLCERPGNITEFCDIHPFVCKGNTSNLLIPKLKADGLDEIIKAIMEIYYYGNITNEFWEEWAWSITAFRKSKMKPVFVPIKPVYIPCYTDNLALNNSEDPEKQYIGFSHQGDKIFEYHLNIQENEQFNPNIEPEVFFSIHSPFVPVDPMMEGISLKLGYKYNIYLRLGEEILMEYPYDTNCENYTYLWEKNNRQGPRSQEMCKELCIHDIFEPNKNMSPHFRMLEYPLELCFDFTCQTSPKDVEILRHCFKNCKASCRSLKYTTTVGETVIFNTKKETRGYDSARDKIEVDIFLGDRQVIVERHIAVYNTGYLFSYIGGLMGCWLGVSIWAFAGIAEKAYRRFLLWMKKIKRYFNETI